MGPLIRATVAGWKTAFTMFEDRQNIELFTEFGWIQLDRQDKPSEAISVLDYEGSRNPSPSPTKLDCTQATNTCMDALPIMWVRDLHCKV